jgi:3-methyladenine DNA glycosylase AlkD
MPISHAAAALLEEIRSSSPSRGELKKKAKAIKRDHDLALELWSTGELAPRLLAALIFDKKRLDPPLLDRLFDDLNAHEVTERNHISEWLLAHQLTKSKKTVALLESWQSSASPGQRRLFWYYQARLRWTGAPPPPNTADLLFALDDQLMSEAPEVQWAMNFTAGWIGIYEAEHRDRCIALGERNGLYKDDVVSRGCTPSYLPEFIRIEVGKREKK